jgi:hypothetical protein
MSTRCDTCGNLRECGECFPNQFEIPGIGEKEFFALDNPLGHGDPHLSHDWVMGLAVPNLGGDAPKGFKFIMDAEMTPVALVPEKLVDAWLELLNGRDS